MEVTITINCDNDAFTASSAKEVERILRELARKMRVCQHADTFNGATLRDINGNTVGKVEVKS